MGDIILRQNVIDELEFEPSIDGTHIGVTAENGVVTLSGHVKTYAEKNKIADVVCRVKGARGIAQEIEVRPRGEHRTADDEIAKRALSVIRWNTRYSRRRRSGQSTKWPGDADGQGRVELSEDCRCRSRSRL